MTLYIILALAGGIAIGAVIFYFLEKRGGRDEGADKQGQAFLMLQTQINELARAVDQKMGESTRIMQSQFGESSKIIKDITQELVKVGEGQKQVMNVTDQLKSLQDILKNPKQRGVLGEYYLEALLKNVLPPGSYEMQYRLGKDEEGKDLIPDAVVFIKDKIIPIDSKFSLENYNRISETRDESEKMRLEKLFVNDLKNRIVETSKYIQPNKGTLEFAFMFIPHEAIYYDLLTNSIGTLKTEDTENLIQRAASKYHVVIVSPTSFLAYLQTVLQGLNALKIEESAKEIRNNVQLLTKHLMAYQEYFIKVGKHLGTTVNAYTEAQKNFKLIDKDVMHITEAGTGYEPVALEKPEEIG